MRFFKSKFTNPFINLSLEDYFFKNIQERVLFFYSNESSVVIGRNQNPFREIDFKALKRNDLQLVRRNSGGGAVYQDDGNLNYCFMMPRSEFERSTSVTLISAALQKLNVPATVSCRYDILVDKKKVSGSAYKLINSRAYHHGTMLINANLNNLDLALSPTKKSLEGGGIASVRSKVTNLTDYSPSLNPDIVCESIMKEFHQKFGSDGAEASLEIIDESFLTPEVIDFANKLQDSKWIFGQTPRFTFTHPIPNSDGCLLKLIIYQGVIEEYSLSAPTTSSVSVDLKSLETDIKLLVGLDFHSLLDHSLAASLPSNLATLVHSIRDSF